MLLQDANLMETLLMERPCLMQALCGGNQIICLFEPPTLKVSVLQFRRNSMLTL